MTRAETLDKAKQIVCTDRNEQYGEPEDNFRVIANLWTAYLKSTGALNASELHPSEVAEMMILFKLGRSITSDNPYPDTFVDIAGYAACACEIRTGAEGPKKPEPRPVIQEEPEPDPEDDAEDPEGGGRS